MARRPTVYGLDIETDTSVDGLDAGVSPVITVVLSSPGFDEVFSGAERGLLVDLDLRMRELEPGVLATWNGSAFDLPFLATRAAVNGVPLGLRLQEDRDNRSYRAAWYEHGHVDAYRVYRSRVGPKLDELEREVRHACARSDARLARILTERRWTSASRAVDRVAPTGVAADSAIA